MDNIYIRYYNERKMGGRKGRIRTGGRAITTPSGASFQHGAKTQSLPVLSAGPAALTPFITVLLVDIAGPIGSRGHDRIKGVDVLLGALVPELARVGPGPPGAGRNRNRTPA